MPLVCEPSIGSCCSTLDSPICVAAIWPAIGSASAISRASQPSSRPQSSSPAIIASTRKGCPSAGG